MKGNLSDVKMSPYIFLWSEGKKIKILWSEVNRSQLTWLKHKTASK